MTSASLVLSYKFDNAVNYLSGSLKERDTFDREISNEILNVFTIDLRDAWVSFPFLMSPRVYPSMADVRAAMESRLMDLNVNWPPTNALGNPIPPYQDAGPLKLVSASNWEIRYVYISPIEHRIILVPPLAYTDNATGAEKPWVKSAVFKGDSGTGNFPVEASVTMRLSWAFEIDRSALSLDEQMRLFAYELSEIRRNGGGNGLDGRILVNGAGARRPHP